MTHTAGRLVARGPNHVFVAEEHPVYVPMLRPNQGLLEILKKVGAQHKSYTLDEISDYLKDYISSRKLYNAYNPVEVNCKDDALGGVFGVEKFTIRDALSLIRKNCYRTEDALIRHQYFTRPIPIATTNMTNTQAAPTRQRSEMAHLRQEPTCQARQQLEPSSQQAALVHQQASPRNLSQVASSESVETPDVSAPGQILEQTSEQTSVPSSTSQTASSASFQGMKRKASEGSPEEAAKHSKNDFPWYFQVQIPTDESEVLSIQDKRTATVKDSSDDLWFLDEETENHLTEDAFSIEYEVPSDHTEILSHSDSSSRISGKDVLVVCRDSDMEFWADSSGDESNNELKDDDWSCEECYNKNSPLQRYCFKCWKLRPGWLPDLKLPSRPRRQRSKVRKDNAASNIELSSDSEGETGIIKRKSLKELSKDVSDIPKSPDMVRRTFLNYQSKEAKLNEEEECRSDKTLKTVANDHNVSSTSMLSSASVLSSQPSSSNADCIICFSQPKTASLIHGSTGHQVCCYRCAKRLKRRKEPCPVCRKPIQKVIRNFLL